MGIENCGQREHPHDGRRRYFDLSVEAAVRGENDHIEKGLEEKQAIRSEKGKGMIGSMKIKEREKRRERYRQQINKKNERQREKYLSN
jgi:hypothetical protein